MTAPDRHDEPAILVDYILHGREERNLEYKASVSWDDAAMQAKLIRSMLGMANLRDGGVIVVGVDRRADDSYDPIGVTGEHKSSFTQDKVQSKANEYADPFVEATVRVVEYEAKSFVVIQVAEFLELPVVCKRDFNANEEQGRSRTILRRGAMYCRPRRKIETVEVPSQVEMREIIELATDKGVRKLVGQIRTALGITTPIAVADQEAFDRQSEKLP